MVSNAVSILVFVELALGLGETIVDDQVTWVFQSLFLWNSPSDFGLVTDIYKGISFNPCFCGTRPRTMGRYDWRERLVIVSILVFVELALGHRNEWCNPHFAGTTLRLNIFPGNDFLQNLIDAII